MTDPLLFQWVPRAMSLKPLLGSVPHHAVPRSRLSLKTVFEWTVLLALGLLVFGLVRARRGLAACIALRDYSFGRWWSRLAAEVRPGLARTERRLADECVLALPRGALGIRVPDGIDLGVSSETFEQFAAFTEVVEQDVRDLLVEDLRFAHPRADGRHLSISVVVDHAATAGRPRALVRFAREGAARADGPAALAHPSGAWPITLTQVTNRGRTTSRRPAPPRPGHDEELTRPAPPLLLRPDGRDAPVIDLVHGQPLTLGRSHLCQIRLTNDLVSRRHARLQVVGDSVLVEDLDSRHGTWVRGDRIHARREAELGDEVRVGDAVFVLEAS
jgi:hypothetical protein